MWILVFIIVVGGGFYLSARSLAKSSDNEKARQVNLQKKLDAIPRQVAEDQDIFLPIFVDLLRTEFSDESNEINEISVMKFYDAITHWKAAHVGDQFSDTHREIMEETAGFGEGGHESFKDMIRYEAKTLPALIGNVVDHDFEEWYQRMDNIIRLATKKALARGYNSRS